MDYNLNSIYLRRKNKIILDKGDKVYNNKNLAVTINRNINKLGYTFDSKLLIQLSKLSAEYLTDINNFLVEKLAQFKGLSKYKPMYPNFPQQVVDMSDAELYINATVHYFSSWVVDVTCNSNSIWLPTYKTNLREPLEEKTEYIVITHGKFLDFKEMMKNVMLSNSSLSETDKSDLVWFLQNVECELPENVPFKETKILIANTVLTTKYHQIEKYFKDSTDVLRLACAMSGGDISLAENTKFKNFNRKERKLLLTLLNKSTSPIDDMVLRRSQWLRLGEKLHPGENRYKYLHNAVSLFNELRNNKKFDTFNSQVEKSIKDMDITKSVSLLVKQPGKLARRLDELLRLSSDKNEVDNVISKFNSVANKISTPVLLQVAAHFKNRNSKLIRSFFPKGNVAKLQVISNNVDGLPQLVCNRVVDVCNLVLKNRFSSLTQLGKSYIDPKLKDYLVPFSQRSASKALKTLVRGSKIDFPNEKDWLRFFIYWKEDDTTGRLDIDLSAVMYNEDWSNFAQVSYTNLRYGNRTDGCDAVHSGDITSAPNGACEFIDLNIPAFLNKGYRYILMNVYSYSQQQYKNMPECYAGWMTREKPQNGEIFDAKTVEQKIDLTAESTIAIPVFFDLLERKAVWCDLSLKQRIGLYGNNTHSNKDNVALMCRAMNELPKPNLYDLFTLHAKGRGEIVKSKSKADCIFSINEGITPFDIEEIMSKYMS